MSSRVIRSPVRGQRRRKATLNLDLNTEPPTDNRDHGGTSNLSTSLQMETSVQGQAEHPATIDIEAIEDDVAVCSPTAFAEAKRKARRNRGRIEVVDVQSELEIWDEPEVESTKGVGRLRQQNGGHGSRNPLRNDLVVRLDPIIHKRRRGANATHQEIVFNDLYINLDRSNKSSTESESDLKLVSSLLPSPKEPIFSCPICMGPLVEETSTKCGHIFCKTCISKAISGQTKCPTCRKKVVMKDLIRIFLPATTT